MLKPTGLSTFVFGSIHFKFKLCSNICTAGEGGGRKREGDGYLERLSVQCLPPRYEESLFQRYKDMVVKGKANTYRDDHTERCKQAIATHGLC